MQLSSWNCRGLGNSLKAEAVKDLLKMEPSDILLLQETNIEEEPLLSISKSKWNKNASVRLGKGHKKEVHVRNQGKCTMHAIEAKEDREG